MNGEVSILAKETLNLATMAHAGGALRSSASPVALVLGEILEIFVVHDVLAPVKPTV